MLTVSKLFVLFRMFSTIFGFSLFHIDHNTLWTTLNIIYTNVNFFLTLICVMRGEMFCLHTSNMKFNIREVIMVTVTQCIILAPLSTVFVYRFNNSRILKILTDLKVLESNLATSGVFLNVMLLCICGSSVFILHMVIVVGTMYYTFATYYEFLLVIDGICIFGFETWVAIPFLQCINFLLFLNYTVKRIRGKIIKYKNIEKQINYVKLCGFDAQKTIVMKIALKVLKQILHIATELSEAYGVTICIFLLQYLSRVVTQFYDLVGKDALRFPVWIDTWNIIVRMMSMLPIFICCEQLKFNVNRTVDSIQEIVALHQPSCLDNMFHSLTLRLQHQSITVKLCGFLEMTYSSLLTIMATTLGFLVFQLQFIET